MEGSLLFGFWDQASLRAPVMDPTIGQILLRIKKFDFAIGDYVSTKEIELTSISKETHPEYFYEGSAFNNLVDTVGFYTARDFSDIVL